MADGEAGFDLDGLLGAMRPRLHRYCARMLGSAFDGEDVVQEALARAAVAYGPEVREPERWLMRIAHNAALDALRRRRRRAERQGDADLDAIADPGAAADARIAVEAGLAAFLTLPPLQRSTVILGDVLGHPLGETSEILGVTDASAKAALHRGRAALRRHAGDPTPPPAFSAAERIRLRAYADRFNARDFDALRALLAEDVRLDLAGRPHLVGPAVGVYFTRYSENLGGWSARPCLADGRLAVAISDPALAADYVVLVEWRGGCIAVIHDYRYAPYVLEAVRLEIID
ncbi:MAG TPA: sigma-70 family RNA polymerase sigma factor [Caulobacteraceae bacterium]|nr:sigma-70 family RNA polymerase sigma factor [Caulobacteraceae bacterium]